MSWEESVKASIGTVVVALLAWMLALRAITTCGTVLHTSPLHTSFVLSTIGLILGIWALRGSERFLAWCGILLCSGFFVLYFGFLTFK